MLEPKTRWKMKEQSEAGIDELVEQLQIDPLVAKLLMNRGMDTIEEARKFIDKNEMSYYDPFLLDEMDIAVNRIHEAIKNNEKILIFGDYDADGVSSTALLYSVLQTLEANVDFYIPNRFTEGYGPNEPALRRAKEAGTSVVITVDTGIAAVAEAEVAKEIGIDFIITDHHETPPELPNAYAIVNPKKTQCQYPFKGLAGVGVAFKLAHALLGRVPTEWLDLAVIGTIADLVPLIDENRLLAIEGLQALQVTNRPGLIALKKKCSLQSQEMNADHVGFALGPRLNAAGRLDSADPAVHLLLTDDSDEAEQFAEEIDQLNKERQTIVSEITEQAIAIVESTYKEGEDLVLIIEGEDWNAGVIGIVASRLVERYYLPTIVLSIDREKGIAKGSARSIEGFDMFHELSKNRELLPHFGGHPMAAGLTMDMANVSELRECLNKQAKEVLTEEDLQPLTPIDLSVTVDNISIDVIQQLERLAPFGMQNPKPKVLLEDVELEELRQLGQDGNHLKLNFAQNGAILEGIGFQLGYLYEELTPLSKVSAIGSLSINEWNGHVKPQLIIEDTGVFDWQLFDWRSLKKEQIKSRLERIPDDERTLVVFDEDTVHKLDLAEFDIHVVDERTPIHIEGKYLVLLDPPTERQQLRNLLQNDGIPRRIYAIFYQESDTFFTTNPNRDQFKWFYAFLLNRKQFNLKEHSQQLEKHKGWSRNTVAFMAQVFLDLKFVTRDNQMLTVVENPEKRNLEDSKTLKQRQERSFIENEFIYSSYHDLRKWFDSVLTKIEQDQSIIKETV